MLTRAHVERARLDRLTSNERSDAKRAAARRSEARKRSDVFEASERRRRNARARTRRVPHRDRSIVRARHHPVRPPRLERRAPYRALVPAVLLRERLRARPVVSVRVFRPNFDRVVVRRRHEHVLRGVPRHAFNVLGVAVKHRDALEVVTRLQLPDPHGLISPAGGEQRAARRPRAGLDLVLVALDDGDALPVAAALRPDRGRGVERRGREEPTWVVADRVKGGGEGGSDERPRTRRVGTDGGARSYRIRFRVSDDDDDARARAHRTATTTPAARSDCARPRAPRR